MILLKRIADHYNDIADRTAVDSVSDGTVSYGELWEKSGKLANYIEEKMGSDKSPVVVYGHKQPYMIIFFLACVRSGRAYCPEDISVPEDRVKSIIERTGCGIILTAEKEHDVLSGAAAEVIDINKAEEIEAAQPEMIAEEKAVSGSDTFYIIFTSGSTGTPKGVQISADDLDSFTSWSVHLGYGPEDKKGAVFMNQAPFSFDLSVMDLYTSLASGGTLKTIDRKTQDDMSALMKTFTESHLNYWISTPSFATMCCGMPEFDEEHMPEMRAFLFCGEALTNTTARRLREKFPDAKIVNTYGPTEATCAVTSVDITDEMINADEPLPVGVPGPNTRISICGPDGRELPEGERGEIIISGKNVSTGYFKDQVQTDKVFFDDDMRHYRSGDEGFIENGQLHFTERMDFQIKYHGYRIELGDIENNLLREPGIDAAAVVPRMREGAVKNLVAFIAGMGKPEDSFGEGKKIKNLLREKLPDYMIPKKIVFLAKMPVTPNGKADRKALKEMIK